MNNLDFSFITWDIISSYLLKGLWFSVQLTFIAMVGGIILGTALALMRLSKSKLASAVAATYINLFRSIPLVMVILWFFLLVPVLLGKPVGAEKSALITFTLFEAAYYAEIIRAGIQSISKGQLNAGQALGLNSRQNLRYVILPQAFRMMIPVLLTQTIVLFQDTSLVYAIGAYDTLKGFDVLGKNFGRSVETYLLATAFFFVICVALSLTVKQLQKRVSIIK